MTRRKILAADLFCGAGGFTTALMRELDSQGVDCELVAINHDPIAIATHTRNHLRARHEIQDLSNVDPEKLCPEGRLDILLASPTCTFHSRARGGKPTSDQQRMDPWVVVTWCTKLRVKRLVCENVPEFVDWGPINTQTGKPIKSRKGEYFRAWIAAFERIGYRVEWRILTAADYGDATTRSRFFMRARNDRRPITWSEPTHTREGVSSLFGDTKRWRAAREIINWSDPGRSIFGRPMPLKPNTLRRIRAGALKFSGLWAEVFRAAVDRELYRSMLYWEAGVGRKPEKAHAKKKRMAKARPTKPLPVYTGPIFDDRLPDLMFREINGRIVRVDRVEFSSGAVDDRHVVFDRTDDYLVLLRGTGGARSTGLPVPALTAGGTHVGLVHPFVFQVNQGNGRYGSHRLVDEPLYAVVTRDSLGLAGLSIEPFTCGNRTNNAARGVCDPIATAVTATGGGIFLARPFLFAQGSNGASQLVDEAPIPTITTVSRIQLIQPVVLPFVLGQHGGAVPRDVVEPLPTIAGSGAIALIRPYAEPFILNRHGDNGGGVRASSLNLPMPTATRSGAGYLVDPYLAVMKGQSYCSSIDSPAPAITTRRHLAMIEPFLVTCNHVGSPRIVDNRLRLVSSPLPTITSKRGLGFAEPFLTPYYGSASFRGGVHSISLPLPTVTTKDRFALVRPEVAPYFVPFFGERPTQAPRFHSVDVPLPAVTSHGAGGLAEPFVFHQGTGGVRPQSVGAPLPTITAGGYQFALAQTLAPPFVVVVSHGNDASGNCERRVRGVDEPLQSVTAGGVQFGVVRSSVNVRSGILVFVDGIACLVDILFRMLRNPELAAAMSFTGDEYSYEFSGTETQITKQIGNAVPVRTARSLIRAELLDLLPAKQTAPRPKARVA